MPPQMVILGIKLIYWTIGGHRNTL